MLTAMFSLAQAGYPVKCVKPDGSVIDTDKGCGEKSTRRHVDSLRQAAVYVRAKNECSERLKPKNALIASRSNVRVKGTGATTSVTAIAND